MKEIWKPIKGYEGRYEISNRGRVKSLISLHNGKNDNVRTENYIKLYDNKGYKRVALVNSTGKTKYMLVHRLVAYHFIGDCTDLQINHKDGVKWNNNVENLEICTASENQIHAYKLGLKKPCDNGFKKKLLLTKGGEVIEQFVSLRDLCRKMNFDRRHLQRVIQGKYSSYRGYNIVLA